MIWRVTKFYKAFKNILFKNMHHIAGIQFEKLRFSPVTKMMDF